jgi:phosphoribosylaminoimidazole (AIR) synthetase
MNNSQTVFEYLGYELIIRCANDLICARALYVQCCSLPTSIYGRSIQRFYQGIDQACQQLDCTLLKTTAISSSSSFNALCTSVCNREFLIVNNDNLIINENDFLIGLRNSSGTINSQGYVQLKELFQKKNIHLNDTLPFRNNDGDEESFFSLLLQKSSILTPALTAIINQLVLNRTIKVIRYLKGKFI